MAKVDFEVRFSSYYGRLGHFIDNKYVEADSDKYIPIYDPGLGKEIAEVPTLSTNDVDEAVRSAARAFDTWSNTFQYLIAFNTS
ncbi:MAG: aldehyde dehydrogenase family protein [Candidatus Nezhaarchaeota archaeon]|nr:aldehyde dehydrogenase family protein [Candidatus Nezhaarchaeota archaeon]